MDDMISRQAAINKFEPWLKVKGYSDGELNMLKAVLYELTVMPSAQSEQSIAEWQKDFREYINMLNIPRDDYKGIMEYINEVPSAQPEQRYTEEELLEFRHGISISLLSKRSSQHWHYDEDTATEIEFLERLYEKVCADMRGEQDE